MLTAEMIEALAITVEELDEEAQLEEWAADALREMLDVVRKLPVTAEGFVATPGMELWSVGTDREIYEIYCGDPELLVGDGLGGWNGERWDLHENCYVTWEGASVALAAQGGG